MFDLKCKRQACEYNKNCNCTAKKIEVKKDTSCETYEPSDKDTTEDERINQPPLRKNIEVDCNAKCLFNEDGVCQANGITVQPNPQHSAPNCVSFQPK